MAEHGVDPFAVLGVGPDADEATLRAARRRLAMDLHPDHEGGDAAAMRRLNAAFDAAVDQRKRDAAGPPAPSPPSPPARSRAGPPPAGSPAAQMPGRSAHDVASFTIEALPAEAFEALLVVATWLGDVLVDEPPYQLDVELGEPFECWCRLDLVPDAGASTVALTLVSHDGRPLPDLDAVRDAWVTNLNHLGHPD